MDKAIVDLQICIERENLPTEVQLQTWASKALQTENEMELTILIVDEAESQALNREYRDKDNPTNVLSFPFEAPEFVEINLLGDLVICAPVVEHEAKEQSKSLESHWAHMVIHGTLHLQGYDHVQEADAEQMEGLEISILNDLGYNNPYFQEAK